MSSFAKRFWPFFCLGDKQGVLFFIADFTPCFFLTSWQISRRVFELIRSEGSCNSSPEHGKEPEFSKKKGGGGGGSSTYCLVADDDDDDVDKDKSRPFEMYKRRTTVFVTRQVFLDVVCDALAEYKYVGRDQRADLILACRYISQLLGYIIYFDMFCQQKRMAYEFAFVWWLSHILFVLMHYIC